MRQAQLVSALYVQLSERDLSRGNSYLLEVEEKKKRKDDWSDIEIAVQDYRMRILCHRKETMTMDQLLAKVILYTGTEVAASTIRCY